MKRHSRLKLLCGLLLVSQKALGNVVGTDTQNFNPTTNGLDFVTVQSSETLEPGIFNFGLFLNHAINSLPSFEDSPTSRLKLRDSLTSMDLNAGVGLWRDLDFGISLPRVLNQSVQGGASGTESQFASTGLTEVRVNSKFRLLGDSTYGLALVTTVNFNLIDNNPFVGRDSDPIVSFEVAGDQQWDQFAFGANIGYRFRNPGPPVANSTIDPVGSQWLGSLAASYLIPHSSMKAVAEIFGATTGVSGRGFGTRAGSALEALLGIKHDVSTELALHYGAGAELVEGLASPDWRVYVGLNYAIGPFHSERARTNPSPIPTSTYLQPVVESQDIDFDAQPVRTLRTSSLHFEFGSDRLTPDSDRALEELVQYLATTSYRTIQIEGHTDSVGSKDYNQALSERRAESIRRRLNVAFRVPFEKMSTRGLGESRPIADNGNYQGRRKNRRVEFRIER